MNSELARRVKEEAVNIFPHSEHSKYQTDFGVDGQFAGLVLAITHPSSNFPKWKKFFLPRPLKAFLSKDNNELLHQLHNEGLYAVHYPVNFEGNLAKLLEREEDLTRRSVGKYQSEFVTPQARSYLEELGVRFRNSSCIYSNLILSSVMIGDRKLIQEVMDYYKKSPLSILNLTEEILGEGYSLLEHDLASWRSIDIYDLIKSPKEVHFSLNR